MRNISQCWIAPDYSYKRWSTDREALHACVYTARRNKLPCTSDVLWTVEFWKLLNQNLTIQATKSDERYPRSTVFNIFEGQTECFVANVVQFLRNSLLSGKLYTLHDFSQIATSNDIQKMAPSGPALSIVKYVGNDRSFRIHRYWTLFLV